MAKKHIVETPITNKQDWLENRLLDVTSTEVSALYDLNPYKSAFELYNEKKEKLIINLEDTSRLAWGRRLEDSIAQGCAEDQGWDVEPFDVYISNTKTRMGSSFDYKITSGDEVGIMEVKNVDGFIYRSKWEDDGNGNIKAPPHIELQLQHQMEVADINWGCIVALVGGNEMKVIKRDRDKDIGEMLRVKVHHFWDRIKLSMPPDIDYLKDSDYILKNLCNHAEPDLGIVADEDMDKLVDYYNALRRTIKKDEDELKSVKAEILNSSQGASKIVSKYGTVNCGMTKGSKGTYVTQEMVGTYIHPRKPFRQFKFNQPKGL